MRTDPIFDTHSLVKRLEQSGLNEKQAEGIVHAISESRSFDYNLLATKPDIAELKHDNALLKQEVDNIKENMATKAELNQVKYDILKWMIPLMMTIIALIISNKFY
jgi:hypothetical protein